MTYYVMSYPRDGCADHINVNAPRQAKEGPMTATMTASEHIRQALSQIADGDKLDDLTSTEMADTAWAIAEALNRIPSLKLKLFEADGKTGARDCRTRAVHMLDHSHTLLHELHGWLDQIEIDEGRGGERAGFNE